MESLWRAVVIDIHAVKMIHRVIELSIFVNIFKSRDLVKQARQDAVPYVDLDILA